MVCHVVILFALVLNSSLVAESPYRKLYVALTLAPLIRIVSLAMPMEEFSTIYQYLIVSLPLLVGIFATVRVLNLKPPDVSLSLGKLHVQGLVALTGVGFALAEYYILRPEPLISSLTWEAILVPALIFVVAVGFVEELAFRGVMQHCSTEVMGSWGLVYVAGIFAVLHIGYRSPEHVLFVFGVGLFFGWIVKKTGSLLGVTLSHGIINIGLYLIIPLLISEGSLQWL